MKQFRLIVLIVLAALGVGTASGSALFADEPADSAPRAEKPTYAVIPIKGGIGDDFTAKMMQAYLDELAPHQPKVIILELDTPGGLIDDARHIVEMIAKNTQYRWVAYVHRALSAGAVITLACETIYVDNVATIGAATSYSVDRHGRIMRLPADVAEKFQSAWRAVARTAAENGKHPSLIAEAMVDPDFALTMKADGDKLIFERDGQGKTIKAAGRILTMTAGEAVKWRVAEGRAIDMADVKFKLGIVDWEQTVVELRNASATSIPLFREIIEKAESMGLHKVEEMTEMQQRATAEEWEQWSETLLKRHALRPDVLELVLIEAQDNSDTMERDIQQLERQIQRVKLRLQGRGLSFSDKRALQNEYRSLNADLKEMQRYPLRVVASDPDDSRFYVYAWVGGEASDQLGKLGKGDKILLRGEVESLDYLMAHPRRQNQTISLIAPVGTRWNCVARLTRTAILKNKAKPGPAVVEQAPDPVDQKAQAEKQAAQKLRLANTYASAGMVDKARELLLSIISAWPDTKSADQAREMLKQLPK